MLLCPPPREVASEVIPISSIFCNKFVCLFVCLFVFVAGSVVGGGVVVMGFFFIFCQKFFHC